METLPTGKQHVSYSEVRCWKECSWRHKLIHIDKLEDKQVSPYLDYGTIVHEACEEYLRHRTIDLEKIEHAVRTAWAHRGFDTQEWIDEQVARAKRQGWVYKHEYLDAWVSWAKNSMQDVPNFLDEMFPGWECVEAEEELFESIPELQVSFKGFIDGIIKFKNKKGQERYLILDWKTAKKYGWPTAKKREFLTQAQLFLYKSFWCKKHNVDPKHVKCGFVLLKRGAKPGKCCSLVEISAGPITIERANKLLFSMVKMLKKKMHLKNRNSCRFCAFLDTEHCQSW